MYIVFECSETLVFFGGRRCLRFGEGGAPLAYRNNNCYDYSHYTGSAPVPSPPKKKSTFTLTKSTGGFDQNGLQLNDEMGIRPKSTGPPPANSANRGNPAAPHSCVRVEGPPPYRTVMRRVAGLRRVLTGSYCHFRKGVNSLKRLRFPSFRKGSQTKKKLHREDGVLRNRNALARFRGAPRRPPKKMESPKGITGSPTIKWVRGHGSTLAGRFYQHPTEPCSRLSDCLVRHLRPLNRMRPRKRAVT